MKTSIIKIGNSKGIRIPKTILKECKFDEEVDMLVEKDRLVIVPYRDKPRSGWEESFKEMSHLKQDKLLIHDGLDLDSKDWEW